MSIVQGELWWYHLASPGRARTAVLAQPLSQSPTCVGRDLSLEPVAHEPACDLIFHQLANPSRLSGLHVHLAPMRVALSGGTGLLPLCAQHITDGAVKVDRPHSSSTQILWETGVFGPRALNISALHPLPNKANASSKSDGTRPNHVCSVRNIVAADRLSGAPGAAGRTHRVLLAFRPPGEMALRRPVRGRVVRGADRQRGVAVPRLQTYGACLHQKVPT